MKKLYYTVVTSLLILVLINCKSKAHSQTNSVFLEGVWQIENKNTYEAWRKISDTHYKGESYKIIGDTKKINETLELKFENNQWVYYATVGNQNQGKTIAFKQKEVPNALVFENTNHDFPKKIIYKLNNERRMYVQVLGENEKGFSFYMIKK